MNNTGHSHPLRGFHYRFLIIISLFCLTHSANAQPCPTERLNAAFQEIGFETFDSIQEAADRLIQEATGQSVNCRDELIFAFRQYYREAMGHWNNKKGFLPPDQSNSHPADLYEERRLDIMLSSVGWKLKSPEGMYTINEREEWCEKRFAGILTPIYRDFYLIYSRELREGYAEDGGLQISWETLRQRIVAWEKFSKQYPDFIESKRINTVLNGYIHAFLLGMDNTPIYDFSTKKVLNEVRSAYELFLKENTDSAYHSAVKQHYETLKKIKFQLNRETLSRLKKGSLQALPS